MGCGAGTCEINARGRGEIHYWGPLGAAQVPKITADHSEPSGLTGGSAVGARRRSLPSTLLSKLLSLCICKKDL